jgi:hypothetical protein
MNAGRCAFERGARASAIITRTADAARPSTGINIMSFGIYIFGFLLMVIGLVYGAAMLHAPAHWIAMGAIVLVGIGILTGVKATRQKDPV